MKLTQILCGFIVVASVCNSVMGEQLPGIITLLDAILNGSLACSGKCLSENSEALQKSFNRTCVPAFNKITMDVQDRSYEGFYNAAFSELNSGKTQMCTWAETIRTACINEPLKVCDIAINTYYNRLTDVAISYICSKDPPILECVMSPSLLTKGQAIANCANPIDAKFGRHFIDENFLKNFANFYNSDVKPNDGALIYSEIKKMTLCVSTAVGIHGTTTLSAGCTGTKRTMNNEVDKILNYFKKTDILSCGLNPDVWQEILKCSDILINDVYKDPQFSSNSAIMMVISKNQLYKFKTHWNKMKWCTLRSIENICGQKWVYESMDKYSQAVDSVILTNGQDQPSYCGKSVASWGFNYQPSGTVVTVSSNMIFLVLAFTILFIM